MALRNGTYRLASGEVWGVMQGQRYGPVRPLDLPAVERGHPEFTVTGRDAEVLALPSNPWYALAERMGAPDAASWVFAPWAPLDLIPPDAHAWILAHDDATRPTAHQWVGYMDHSEELPNNPAKSSGGGSLLDWLRGTLTIAGKAIPRWTVGAAGLVVLYLLARR